MAHLIVSKCQISFDKTDKSIFLLLNCDRSPVYKTTSFFETNFCNLSNKLRCKNAKRFCKQMRFPNGQEDMLKMSLWYRNKFNAHFK